MNDHDLDALASDILDGLLPADESGAALRDPAVAQRVAEMRAAQALVREVPAVDPARLVNVGPDSLNPGGPARPIDLDNMHWNQLVFVRLMDVLPRPDGRITSNYAGRIERGWTAHQARDTTHFTLNHPVYDHNLTKQANQLYASEPIAVLAPAEELIRLNGLRLRARSIAQRGPKV